MLARPSSSSSQTIRPVVGHEAGVARAHQQRVAFRADVEAEQGTDLHKSARFLPVWWGRAGVLVDAPFEAAPRGAVGTRAGPGCPGAPGERLGRAERDPT